jgi:hypothetical protein
MSAPGLDPIAARVAAQLGAPDLVDRLAALPASELTSLLLAVARARAAALTPAELLAQAERTALVRPTAADPRQLRAFDARALDAALGFEAVELAPVAPFGVDAVLGRISPNNVLPTIRPVQVLADPTASMALEAARRRRRARDVEVRLATSARCVRMQPLTHPSFTPHFRVFALATAGRDAGNHDFELRALGDHLGVHLRLLAALTGDGYGFAPVEVWITDSERDRPAGRARLDKVAARLFPALGDAFPEVGFRIDETRTQGLGYYDGLMLQIWTTTPDGERMPLGDGGFAPWTQRLLADRKERFIGSGLGQEMVCKRFRVSGGSR